MRYKHLSVAIPLLAELENLPNLIASLESQSYRNFDVYLCVNNPKSWSESDDEFEHGMYENNMETLRRLDTMRDSLNFNLTIINSQWTGKQKGVGYARKTLFDAIAETHDDNELIVSLDADTDFYGHYFDELISVFNATPDAYALAVPYYNPLCGEEALDRAMLRYEIYMRHYLISLLEIDNPYAFTALGSAMVFPLKAYRSVGGITPLQGGEDFYLMQKFAKTGRILLDFNETVRPQGRPSRRVPFGTGPAIAKGMGLLDESYPLYPHEGFKAVADTYALFPRLYDGDIETPMSSFLRKQLKSDDLWSPLRKNFKTRPHFVHACTERVDGLRILQYLKTFPVRTAEEELQFFCQVHHIDIQGEFNFATSSVSVINSIRNQLFEVEKSLRHSHQDKNNH